MAGRKRKNVTTADYDRWWSQGYGRGEGANYKPWMRVQDFRSRGISTRLAGGVSKGQSDTFSLGERDLGNLLQYFGIPYQEQKPIYPLPDVQALAKALGIEYPVLANGTPVVLTYDYFLPARSLFFPSGPGALHFKQRSTFAPGAPLRRDLEKLELYRRHSLVRGWDMRIIDERFFGANASNTLRLLKQCSMLPQPLVAEHSPEQVLDVFKRHCRPEWTLKEIRRELAKRLSVLDQDALRLFKNLLWTRRLGLRLSSPFELHLPVDDLHIRNSGDANTRQEETR